MLCIVSFFTAKIWPTNTFLWALIVTFYAFRLVFALVIRAAIKITNLEFLTHKLIRCSTCVSLNKFGAWFSSSCICRMFVSVTEVQIRWKVFHRVRIRHTVKRLRRRLVRAATKDYSTTSTKNTALVRKQRTHSVSWRSSLPRLAQLLQGLELLKLIFLTELFLLWVFGWFLWFAN